MSEENTQEETSTEVEDKKSPAKRKLIAVGDLHGDYFRLIRILKEENVIIVKDKDNFEWNPEANSVDVVTLGDYCDWRGEPLEGPITEWIYGSKKDFRSPYKSYGTD